jgi:hypothetical protein
VLRFMAKTELKLDLGATSIVARDMDAIASYSDSKNLISINETKPYFNDRNFLHNALVKEYTHRSDAHLDETVGRAARELNGYLNAVQHSSFKLAPERYKTDFLQGAGVFIWQFKQEALITDNAVHKKYWEKKVDSYLLMFGKAGVEFDFSKAEQILKNNQEFYGRKDVRIELNNRDILLKSKSK